VPAKYMCNDFADNMPSLLVESASCLLNAVLPILYTWQVAVALCKVSRITLDSNSSF